MDDFFAPTEQAKYMVNPRLGTGLPLGPRPVLSSSLSCCPPSLPLPPAPCPSPSPLHQPVSRWLARHSAMLRDQHARVRAEYKTVKAVNGPLVILEDVKVRSRFRHICVHLDNALTSGLPGLCASAVPQVR